MLLLLLVLLVVLVVGLVVVLVVVQQASLITPDGLQMARGGADDLKPERDRLKHVSGLLESKRRGLFTVA